MKISQLRGTTAKKACVKITEEIENVMTQFYTGLIPNIVTLGQYRFPIIRITNQADLIRFLKSQSKGLGGTIYSSSLIEDFAHPTGSEFILLFDDTLRIDIKWNTELYKYRYVPSAISQVNVTISVICLDKQKFLDALHIEPETEIPTYIDILGNTIHVGDVICVSSRETSRLYLDRVKHLTPYSIVSENGRMIRYETGYDNKIVVISDLQSKLLK